ncbi:hypothetical protein CAL29_03030 [Bordetella genomosp. 10]|uniref:argininosuccinate lyase n=1 Tax=Bordetella genomosp. 10 TaxID=1416804 RepID=A0A261SM80_9BORD|nr:argininosuccinate lyase [Bordetella genomosp. 10]OZI37403.1 hypothetical protein CAL29_03030 [Bordetella genomosp. 10]
MSNITPTGASPASDVNAVFRGGARAPRWLSQINMASLRMLAERGIVARDKAAAIARGVLQLHESVSGTGADYLDYEKQLTALVGDDASLIHAGRSRQDISSTLVRMNLRDDLLGYHQAIGRTRSRLAELAARHRDTLIPAYTHGVQAQPTTLAHYLLAFSSALGRQMARLADAWKRVNLCTLGTAALSTSSFPIDRRRLTALLGFDGMVENAYDANQLGPVDSSLELAGALASCAVQIGMFAQDLHAQYASPTPWMTLQGALTGISSLMPQKRNPAALEQLRAQSSLLLAELQGPYLTAHNVRSGMFDYRAYEPLPPSRPGLVLDLLEKVVGGLMVDPAQARAEVEADYSTATEIADKLMQKAGVPFRIGHHYASELTDLGRRQKKALKDIPYAEASRLYREQTGAGLPLDEQDYAQCIDAGRMIAGRQGLGGPQPGEIDRLLQADIEDNARAGSWNDTMRERLETATRELSRLTHELTN